MKTTVPVAPGARGPVSVQAMAPVPPTAGCVLAVQAVRFAGSGAPHVAVRMVVKAGVASAKSGMRPGVQAAARASPAARAASRFVAATVSAAAGQ